MKETIYSPGELINLKVVYKYPHRIHNAHIVHVYFDSNQKTPGMELIVDESVLERIKFSDKKNSKSKFNHPHLLEKFEKLQEIQEISYEKNL